jgi:cation:H+ antiporter
MLSNIAELIIGLLLLIWGADRFVHGAGATARNLGVAPLLIGLTIVAFATSAPEILISIVAAFRGETDLAVGNAIGSNITNIGLVLGGVALLRPIEITSSILRHKMLVLLAVTLLTAFLFLDYCLSLGDGFVLLTGLLIVMAWLCRLASRSSADDPITANYAAKTPYHVSMRTAIFWLVIGLATLLVGAELMVDGAMEIARALGVTELVIGIILIALATSLPEFAVSLASAMKGEYGLVLGNIIGSNIFNLLAVIGAAAIIEPARLPPSVLSLHIIVLVAFTLVLFVIIYRYNGKRYISRLEGVALLIAFLAYDTYVVVQNV